ncbi:InlB B-repeat-containing protein [Sporofaciens sp. SGI.106]|uniref:InlB B-repeat-containing protein n=1 Tax=Sporofaciens sp. SGI.106 TaxID=3420568 RepID=UPI003D0429A9
MKDKLKRMRKQLSGNMRGILLGLCLVMGVGATLVYAAENSTDNRKLQNGSFEEGQTWTSTYLQLDQSAVPAWNTTAFQGKIELFRENRNTYISGVTLKPTDGSYAAELNADEESTLYQNVKTSPSSVYEWGLDHGARNGTDTMALVIGPKQSVDPSKPSKAGRDQLMQMVDWLIAQGKTSVKTSSGLGERLTVYSKKFAASGTFEDNAGNNAFSLTPSTIYTEEWHIWIMASSRATSGINPWNSYGSNAKDTEEVTTQSNSMDKFSNVESFSDSDETPGMDDSVDSTNIEVGEYYHYIVPAGQTETLFGFVSVGYVDSPTTPDKAKTYGNFLDNINFQIYHPLSGSTTTHGSAVVGGSDGKTEGEGSTEGHEIRIDKNLATYVKDGEPLKVQAVVKKADAEAGCEFVGVYYTVQDESGNPKTKFLQLAGNEIEDTGSLTDEQKKGKWIKSTNEAGDTVYTYYLEGITSATDLHFVFIKSPTVTYDPNGGKPYVVERKYNTKEAENVYSFKPALLSENINGVDAMTGATPQQSFISPYVSDAAEGQNDGWKFMGWLLTGDTVYNVSDDKKVNADQLGSLVLPAVHTIACDYSIEGATGEAAEQYFKIYNGNVSLTETINKMGDEVTGVTWNGDDKTIAYANDHKGLTMVAQWRWLQAFIPQVGSGTTYTDSAKGGIVEITSVTDKSDTNYNDAYNANGGKSYHATTDETITVTATAKDGFTFEGWYDASGNLVTTNTEYSYVETKESVNTYYARFSGSVTQKYIRQVKNGGTWEDTTDDNIGTLGRYEYIDAPGMPISSTATAGTGYKFVGWYDSDGNKVADDMLINDGATISYTTTKDATYYARFETAYTVKFVAQTKQANGSFKTDNVGGKVSVASVKDVDGATASSKATANSGYKFLGWYDKNGNQLSTKATYSTTTTSATNGVTYYARFEMDYKPTVDSQVYLSFIAESEGTQIPSAFDGRNAGTGINAEGYGLDSKFGNTIATGFKYSLNTMTNVSTIQITVTVPDSAYVKVGGTGTFSGNGNSILTDGSGVKYNKGSIQQISGATTLTYYWDASDLEANTTYGFIIDNLYAPGATATITVNGTAGTKVTNDNGVVNTASGEYRGKSHYPQ